MQLGKFFRKAFGFDSPEEEEAELEGIDARVVPRRISAPHAVENADSGVTVVTSDSSVAEPDSDPVAVLPESLPVSVPDSIFNTVVEVFDASLPDFMRQTVDGKAQREYLYERLSDDMKEYIRSLEADADTRCRARWEAERVALQRQMEAINEKVRKEEGERDDAKKQQLSAERQKRALNERVRDLEKQIATLEAENEQYILENKSLVNKLRITSVTGGAADVDEALAKEIEDLTARLLQSESRVKELTSSIASLEEERAGVGDTLKTHEAEAREYKHRVEELEASLKESTNMAQTLQTEVGKLQEALEQSRVKDDLGDAMLTDLNAKASQAMREAEELRQSAAKLQGENARLEQEAEQARKLAAKTEKERQEAATEVKSLRREVSVMQSRLAEEQAKLQEAMKNLAVVEELGAQLDKLEEAKRANDATRRQQNDEIAKLREEVATLRKENSDFADTLRQRDESIRSHEKIADSLRKTIENNLYEHAQTESALRSEIDRLSGRHIKSSVVPVPSEPSSGADDREKSDDGVVVTEPDFEITPVAPRKEHKPRKKKATPAAEIDEAIENADWLVAIPATPSAKPVPPREDADFGYREPQRKITPDNPAQMSLW